MTMTVIQGVETNLSLVTSIDYYSRLINDLNMELETMILTPVTRCELILQGICLGPIVFSKSMKGKILNFLHGVEKMISVISVQV